LGEPSAADHPKVWLLIMSYVVLYWFCTCFATIGDCLFCVMASIFVNFQEKNMNACSETEDSHLIILTGISFVYHTVYRGISLSHIIYSGLSTCSTKPLQIMCTL
jgi:Na+/proline symporter